MPKRWASTVLSWAQAGDAQNPVAVSKKQSVYNQVALSKRISLLPRRPRFGPKSGVER